MKGRDMNETEIAAAIFAAMKAYTKWLAFHLAIIIVVGAVLSTIINKLYQSADIARDDSDPPKGRSDLLVLTDHLTGKQYLVGPKGGITPRLPAKEG
jgi:hypothetical protein